MNNNEIPKTGFAGFKSHFKEDLISGFSVSLIALPLSLGIALASGVPPLAGVVTAIVGGIIGSRLAGSFVTISGPAAGLIVITLGAPKPKGEILEVASDIPHAFTEINMGAVYIAIVSLVILITHPYIKSKIIKLIPAPMWVLIVTIPFARYLGVENLAMVNLDGGLLGDGGLQLPSFSKIDEGVFWIAVVGVALVSAIESLLSAKAVDTLDPYKRNSDLDKDLMAMGGGSSIAAVLGGLPMISEIVRSSANVTNGAKTQWANFYHGILLLVYVLIGVTIIEMIPIAALAAMLVFTGFKLAHPKEFIHKYKNWKNGISYLYNYTYCCFRY